MTKEDTAGVKAVTGELIFGYNEQERIRLLNEVYKELQTQIHETTQKALKFKEAAKKMMRKQEKD